MKEHLLDVRNLYEDRPSIRDAIYAMDGDQHIEPVYFDESKLAKRDTIRTFLSLRLWLKAYCGYCACISLYSVSYFSPTIVQQIGSYTGVRAMLMSYPPFAVSLVYSVLIALVSDHFQWRFISAFLAMVLSVIGFAVMYAAEGSMTKYGGLIMLTCGCYSGVPPMFAWIANSSAGHFKRATGIALLVVFNNCAGLTSCFLFPDKDKKNDCRLGKLVNLDIAAAGAFFVLLIEVLTWFEVKKREKGKRDYRVVDLALP